MRSKQVRADVEADLRARVLAVVDGLIGSEVVVDAPLMDAGLDSLGSGKPAYEPPSSSSSCLSSSASIAAYGEGNKSLDRAEFAKLARDLIAKQATESALAKRQRTDGATTA